MTRPPKWVAVTVGVAVGSLLLTLLLGWWVAQWRRHEERSDCDRVVAARDDSRAMWLYVIGLSYPDRTPDEEARFQAFVAELDKRLPPLTCKDGDAVPGR